MKIEILYPEICTLYGDKGNTMYLQKCLPDAEFVTTGLNEKPLFLKENIDMVYMCSMSEKSQELVLDRLMQYKDEIATSLPYGLQRRLEIARALATDPKLLLLDEPAAGMNPAETAQLTELIAWIREHYHLTILLIEHDMSLVMKICERIYVLDYGMVIADGTPEEIKNNRKVIEAYLGEDVNNA